MRNLDIKPVPAIIMMIVGGALLAATIRYLGLKYPGILVGGMFTAGSGFILFQCYRGLCRGVIYIGKFSTSTYYRDRNPIGFWFYIILLGLLAILILIDGFYLLFHPHLH